MLLLYLITFLVAIAVTVFGVVVYVRSPQNEQHGALLALTLSIALWMSVNILSNAASLTHGESLLINKLVFVTAGLVLVTPLWFIQTLVHDQFLRRLRVLLYVLSAVPLLSGFSSLVVRDVIQVAPVTKIVFGEYALVYFMSLFVFLGLYMYALTSGLRRSKGAARSRLQVIGLSTLVAVSFALLMNGVLPYVFSSYIPSLAGPLGMSIVVVGYTYSVVKLRMFDVRLAVLRGLGYTVTLSSVFGLIAVAAAVVFRQVYGLSPYTRVTFLLFVCSSIVVGLFFRYISVYIEAVTLRLFYRNSYRTERVLSDLSRELVAASTKDTVLAAVQTQLERTVRPQHTMFIEGSDMGTEATDLRSSISLHNSGDMIDLDTPFYGELKHAQSGNCIILQLGDVRHVDMLVLGNKKNGSAYTRQDIELLRTVAKITNVALEKVRLFERTLSFNAELKAKIQAATAELETKNVRLAELLAAQDEFLSMAAHQLKPQIMAAEGFGDLLRAQLRSLPKQTSAEQLELLSLLTKSIKRIGSIMGDMVYVTHPTKAQLLVNPAHLDFYALVQREIADLAPVVEQKELVITYSTAGMQKDMYADAVKLGEAVANLLSNAVQYSAAASTISCTVEFGAEKVVFEVRDNGIGVPESSRSKLFKKYTRAPNAAAVRPTGTGVGLFVVKKIIELHHGLVYYRPGAPTGSVFGFELPYTYAESRQKVALR